MQLLFTAKAVQNKTIILLFILFFLSDIHAQNTSTNEVPVITILKNSEKRFNLSFSYNKRELRGIKCEAPSGSATLEETLQAITENCTLQFYRIDERYIAVQVGNDPLISVCGTLIDTATGAPLIGASVISQSTQTSTDSGGVFNITAVPGDATISLYHMGFKVKEIKAEELSTENDCPLVFTEQRFNYLPTVLLSSYLTKGISKNAEGSVSISNKNFEILPSLIDPDVLKIAQILPGIESFNETASDINIRGGNNDEVLLLWDGIRMYQSGHFFGLISAFNPNLTQDVTVYKNGTHPRFGESVSGVISMKSDSEIPEKVKGAASIDFISTQFYAKIPASETFAIHLSGRTSINTGLGNPVYNQFFKRVFQNTVVTNFQTNTTEGLRSTDEAFNFYDINGKAIWQLSNKDKLEYNFLTIFNKLQFTERITGETSLSKNESELKQQSLVHGITWVRDWSNKLSSKLVYNSIDYVNNGANQNVDTGQTQSQRNDVVESKLMMELFYTFNSDLSVNAGYQHAETVIENESSPFVVNEIFTTRDKLVTNGFFIHSKWKLFSKNSILTAGFRYTDYPNLDQQFLEPRLNVYQKINSELSVTASAEQKHQAIIQTTDIRNNLLGIENQRWIILGSESTPILENNQIALGTTFKKDDWTFGIEGFYKKVEGVNTANQGFRNQLVDAEALGSYEVTGMEASISKKTEHLDAWLSFTYMDNEYTFDSLIPVSFRSNYDISHALSLALSYTWKSLLFSIGTSYHSGIPYTTPVDGNAIIVENDDATINFNEPNNATLQDFFRTDFSAGYTLPLDKTFTGKINIGLVNVFNRKNSLDSYYVLDEDQNGNVILNRVEQFSLGFTPNISFKLLF
ncbi:MAG: TonB-dependent receptor [Bacteroidia bacterium]|nr:TonB-dependent receptor [Bacteroidia bacterium]